jgi:hypothetical protein
LKEPTRHSVNHSRREDGYTIDFDGDADVICVKPCLKKCMLTGIEQDGVVAKADLDRFTSRARDENGYLYVRSVNGHPLVWQLPLRACLANAEQH